ncbi:helix-turn-helix domain-containing protein [Myroides odoratus]|uniref:helix-turn-helix domain-containing protein n=1 Tax=Myroides odoratus TaxID=256 RepID=UPI00286EB35A|nr:LysR family transcriptional regulator [Myroides odoratus]
MIIITIIKSDFKLFEKLARHGSFTKEADAMFTVQSNVKARVKSLAEELESTLFL